MKTRNLAAAVAASVALLGSGAGLALASASTAAPVNDPAKPVYACIGPTGRVDYLEYRGPQPHACWFKGEKLYELSPGAPAPSPSDTATSPAPSPSDTSTSPAPTPSAS